MRVFLATVVAFVVGVFVVVPYLRKEFPDIFPAGVASPRFPASPFSTAPYDFPSPGLRMDITPQVVREESKKCSAKDRTGKIILDTDTLPPRLPRITTPQTIRAFVTAYDPYDRECVGANAGILPRKTPYGVNVETHGIAVDPEIIPYGSTIKIPGMPPLIADDTGCAMRLAARDPNIVNFYQLDVRVPAGYGFFTNPMAARKEAHVRAGGITATLGSHWLNVEIVPPQNAE